MRYPSTPDADAIGGHECSGRQTPSPSGPAVTVYCVDDQAFFRETMRTVIARTSGFIQIGEAACGEDAISAVATLRPDLVLMDVHLPGMSGFEATAALLHDDPNLRVAVMSADVIEPPAGFAPRAGAVVFVSKGELCPGRLLELWHALADAPSAITSACQPA